ncbi:MAG: hypothetical protein IJV71_09710 [Lachnospiraceae bacterium]|nr:hypothetical protein [Clostridia bacterium]MBQ9700881.1 hypothetical protein [Lachnospiraceae bacterium]
MKKTAAIIIADQKAIDYFCLLKPVQAKKVLFAMSLLKGDQRLGDSNVAEARHIAGLYDGVILAAFAKELAANLASEYSKSHPGVLLTKKKAEAYKDARYRKLSDALGLYGLDYVVTALQQSKAYIADPHNGIDEKHMLQALRWVERKEGVDPETSNDRHRRKGIQLVGLGDMMEVLLPHSFAIASVYELVTPGVQNVPGAVYAEEEDEDEEPVPMTVLDMKIHFIENAHLLQDFYGTKKPEVPEGYDVSELAEGTPTYSLAQKDYLKNSEVVLKYVEDDKLYKSCIDRLNEVFSEEEIQVIQEHAETVQQLIKNAW